MLNFSKKKKDGLALYPTALQRAALLQKAAFGGPLVMLNLLKFKNIFQDVGQFGRTNIFMCEHVFFFSVFDLMH